MSEEFWQRYYRLLPDYFSEIEADKRQTERLSEFISELVAPLHQELSEMRRRADNAEHRVVAALNRGLFV